MEKKMLSTWVLLLLTCSAIIADGSLLELSKMIKQVTGKSAIPNYSSYGCHCGAGGKGRPKDLIDQCCHQHDCCYERLEHQSCNPKTDMYSYDYRQGKVHCDGSTSECQEKEVTKKERHCVPGGAMGCKKKSCECDRIFTECLRTRAHSYRKAYTYFPNFLCSGQTPQC